MDLNTFLLLRHLPESLASKIIYYLLSYGTPSSLPIRLYIKENMHKLSHHFDENHRTIWRYRAYNSQYRFIRENSFSRKGVYYQTSVRYEIILALIDSHHCLMTMTPQNVLGDLKEFVQFTLNKLLQIKIFALLNSSYEGCGVRHAIIIKEHFKNLKRKKFERDFD
jgi:hypothetical protein